MLTKTGFTMNENEIKSFIRIHLYKLPFNNFFKCDKLYKFYTLLQTNELPNR